MSLYQSLLSGTRSGKDGGRHCRVHTAQKSFPQARSTRVSSVPGDRAGTHRRRVGQQSDGRRTRRRGMENFVNRPRGVATVGRRFSHTRITAVLQRLLAQLSERCARYQPLPARVRNFRVSIDSVSSFDYTALTKLMCHRQKQESRAAARKPRDAARVLFC